MLTQARDLRRRRAREEQGVFVTEGVRAVEELVASALVVRGALVSPKLASTPRGEALRVAIEARGIAVTEVSDRDFASAADTDAPQGVLAVAEIPTRTLPTPAAGRVFRAVVLDGVQDPGNVGTIVRTAAALGVDATIALPGTVDFWNVKVVRGAMGALFRHAALHASTDDVLAWATSYDIALWGADGDGTAITAALPAPERTALVMGNEGAGLSIAMSAACARTVAIPIGGGVESLNVAVATGILVHALRA
jgi:TrmH family RNA methyltransferase